MKNVYLESLREKYKGLQQSITGMQTRAAEAKRDLTAEELRSVTEMGSQAEALYDQIESLSAIEVRNAKVDAMNARVTAAMNGGSGAPVGDDEDGDDGTGAGAGNDGGTGGQQQRGAQRLGGARSRDRDPGTYQRGGEFSFVGDQYRMAQGDAAARDRIMRHNVAVKDSDELRDVLGAGATTYGAGLVPPVWLAQYFAPILHKRLRVAAQLQQVPWAGPFPWTIPIAGTPASTGGVAEGVNTTETDPSYTTITVTPQTIMGYSEVSRQMLEAANPAVDAIIWNDLLGDFYDKTEGYVITAINGQSGVNTITISAGALTTTDILLQRSGLLDGIAAISDNNAGDARIYAGRMSRWTTYLKMVDGNGRPLIVAERYGPINAIGEGGATNGFRSTLQGSLENLDVATSPTIAASTGFIINPDEILFSVSPPQQFQFEQPAGPALIRVGIWGYETVVTGRRPKAITKVTYSGS